VAPTWPSGRRVSGSSKSRVGHIPQNASPAICVADEQQPELKTCGAF
jgi:hypothetical protein